MHDSEPLARAEPAAASGLDPAAPDWFAALTLRERVALGAASLARDEALGHARLEEWREQAPFGDDDALARRLAADGMTPESFRAVLGVDAAALAERAGEPPAWAARLAEVFRERLAPLPGTGEPGPGFLEPFAPVLRDAQARLNRAAAEIAARHPDAPFDAETAAVHFARGLFVRVAHAVGRVFTLELHVARLQELLAGETPAERFGSFVARLKEPEPMAALLAEYATMSRLLARISDQWVGASAEVLERLAADAPLLAERFGGGAPLGRLAGVEGFAVGDPHRDGRSVAILAFDSGRRVVLKPRPLAVDAAFAEALRWVSATGACPPLRAPVVLERGAYGWAEFVEAAPCRSRGEVERHYLRLGAILALLHVLDGQDMHMENLIAAGEHPVLVDFETLFHPALDEVFAPAERDEPQGVIARSVLKTALLPQRMWADEDGVGVDLSGVGGAGNQVVAGRAASIENAGTDEMRVARVQVVTQAADNLPALGEETVSPEAFVAEMEAGFAAAYRAIAARREAFAAEVVERFRGASVRVVLRMTQTYALLLREGTHPDFLRDALPRDRFFDKLWLAEGIRPALGSLIPWEHAALHRGDIPVFTTTPESSALVADTGPEVPGLLGRSGFERVAERLAEMGEDDLARQRWLLRASMATLAEAPHGHPPDPAAPGGISPLPGEPGPAPGTRRDAAWADAACEVAERLEALAIRGPRLASWLSLTTRTGRHSHVKIGGYDLHGGAAGIVVFLARLREVAGTERFDALGRGAFAMLRELLHDGDVGIGDVGGFSGLGGVLVALSAARSRWSDLPVPFLAERVIGRLHQRTPGTASCNVFSGLAGAVGGALEYARAGGADGALEAAVRCGDRLLALASPEGTWTTPGAPDVRGFAFGAAGIAHALLRLSAATGEARFREAGLEALARERRAGALPAEGGWMRGAAGSALAWLAARDVGGEGWEAPLREAVDTVVAGLSAPAPHGLADGRMGEVDVLLRVARALSDPALEARAREAAAALVAEAREGGWRLGLPRGLEAPGLGNGLAGIGHAMLALADPARVPSVLAPGAPRPEAGW